MRTPLALLSLGLSWGAMLFSCQPSEEKPVWHSDWATAQRIAREANKPIFAVLVCQH